MKINVVSAGVYAPLVVAVRVYQIRDVDIFCVEVQTDWKASWGAVLTHMEGWHCEKHSTKCIYIPKRHAQSSTQILLTAETIQEERQLLGRDLPVNWDHGFRLLIVASEFEGDLPSDRMILSWHVDHGTSPQCPSRR